MQRINRVEQQACEQSWVIWIKARVRMFRVPDKEVEPAGRREVDWRSRTERSGGCGERV